MLAFPDRIRRRALPLPLMLRGLFVLGQFLFSSPPSQLGVSVIFTKIEISGVMVVFFLAFPSLLHSISDNR